MTAATGSMASRMAAALLGAPVLRRAVLALAPCALLAGCSGEPSESDMRRLVETHTRKALDAKGTGGFRGFDDFRKQGCIDTKAKSVGAAQGGTQYDCYYAATFVPQPGRPAITVNGKGRFTRAGQNLLFEDLGAQPR